MKITVKDVARLLAVPEETVFAWIRKGTIPHTQVHEQYRFNRAEVLEWATERRMPVSVDLFPSSAENQGAAPGLGDALEAGGIHYDLPGTDRASVLRALVDVLDLPEDVDRELLLEVLVSQEALGSTGMGNGIAIPHVRHPIVLDVERATVTLCFLAQPVDVGAIDGKPVTTLFFLVTPTTRAHLHLLARISAALHDRRFEDALTRRAPREEILAEARRAEASLSRQDPERTV